MVSTIARCIIQLFAGVIYAWSILKTPLTSEFSWTAAQLALNYTLSICFFSFGGTISGLLSHRVTVRQRLLSSTVMVSAGFIISAFIDGTSTIPLYLAYGVMVGTGIGIVFNTVISTTIAWFPDKKGVCSGALGIGFGFSGLILGNIAGRLIDNPSFGWRNTYLLLGISIGIVLLLGSILVRYPSSESFSNIPRKASSNNCSDKTSNFTSKEMIARFSFLKLFLFFTLLASVGSTALSFAKDFALFWGGSEKFSINIVGILSISNGLGRISAGLLFDHFGIRRTQLSASAIVLTATVLGLLGCIMMNLTIGIIGMCLCSFSYGYSGSTLATMTSALYGEKNYASNFSFFMTHLIPASFTATLAGSLVTNTGSYISTFLILIMFSVVGLIINLSIRKA